MSFRILKGYRQEILQELERETNEFNEKQQSPKSALGSVKEKLNSIKTGN